MTCYQYDMAVVTTWVGNTGNGSVYSMKDFLGLLYGVVLCLGVPLVGMDNEKYFEAYFDFFVLYLFLLGLCS